MFKILAAFFASFFIVFLFSVNYARAQAPIYYLSCSNSVCQFVDENGQPVYQGDSSVVPPVLNYASPSCLDGKPVVTLGWTNSTTLGVGWTHFDRFKLLTNAGITTAGSGQSNTVISTTSPIQVELGYAGSAPIPDQEALDSHLIPYSSYIQLEPDTYYIYSLRAQVGFENPPQGIQSPPSNVFLIKTGTCPVEAKQNMPIPYCEGVVPTLNLSWSPHSSASRYKILYKDSGSDQIVDNNIFTNDTSIDLSLNTYGLVSGEGYGFIIAALNSRGSIISYSDGGSWSHEKFGTYSNFPVCSKPQVSLAIQTPTGIVMAGDIPAQIKQQEDAYLLWGVTGADSCSAIANPQQAYWQGAKSSVSGVLQIPDTTKVGSNIYSLTCVNINGSAEKSIQLNTTLLQLPYIQTTGGDVHSNESIRIPRLRE